LAPDAAGSGTRAERDRLLAEAEVILGGWPFPLDLRARAPNLKWFHQRPAGAGNLLMGDLSMRRIYQRYDKGSHCCTVSDTGLVAKLGNAECAPVWKAITLDDSSNQETGPLISDFFNSVGSKLDTDSQFMRSVLWPRKRSCRLYPNLTWDKAHAGK
jgi:hypothetical protein